MRRIDRDVALARLGVRPQTLEGLSQPRSHPRGSRSARRSPAPLQRRRSLEPHDAAGAWTQACDKPAIATRLSAVYRGRLALRVSDAVELARTAALEETAALLWGVSRSLAFATSVSVVPDAGSPPSCRKASRCWGAAALRWFATRKRSSSASRRRAGPRPARTAYASVSPERWRCDDGASERPRRVPVLLAGHDLNARPSPRGSAHPIGASLPASVLAGLCALSAPDTWRRRSADGVDRRRTPRGGGRSREAWLDPGRPAARVRTSAVSGRGPQSASRGPIPREQRAGS